MEKKSLLGFGETQPERAAILVRQMEELKQKKKKAKLGEKTCDSVAGRRGLGPDPDDRSLHTLQRMGCIVEVSSGISKSIYLPTGIK